MVRRAADGVNWFFVDEADDPTFYDRHGSLIVGQAGCSPILLLGFIETTDPHGLGQAIAALHAELAADDYLKGVQAYGTKRTWPFMLKTMWQRYARPFSI